MSVPHHTLQELDMSKNLLGKDENLNAVQPDFVTGGESLSELIRHESCPIQILNVGNALFLFVLVLTVVPRSFTGI
jgi:hypothetical protein